MKISNKIIPLAYDIAKRVYEKTLNRNEGIKHLVEAEMNPNSAADYINDFKYMVEGKRFTRALNFSSFKYFLDNIRKDYDFGIFSLALLALKQHIEYFENDRKDKVILRKVRKLYDSYYTIMPIENINEVEQIEITNEIIKANLSKEMLLEELMNIKETDPEVISINGKAYKRDNRTIAQIKILRDFKCQLCGKTIEKKDGSKYVEAAHIKPKHLKGCETLNNIILLCPNHHKEFDLGNSSITNHTDLSIEIIIEGSKFLIEFEKNPA